MAEPVPPAPQWHALPVPAALAELGSGRAGLPAAEAARRLGVHGPNRLPGPEPPRLLSVVAAQFRSPLIYLLVGAAVVAAAVGEMVDAAFIGVVLALNAAIGSWQEWRAERSAHALQRLVEGHATVRREGEAREVEIAAVVPGDIVELESGGRVPADLRLVETAALEIDESLLTGESVPVAKDAAAVLPAATPAADRRNRAWAGSMVTRGRGAGVVTATGHRTLIGGLARDMHAASGGKPPLLQRLEGFSRVVAVATMVAVAVLAALALARGFTAGDVLLFGVALAVSVIPEGLPVAITVALAVAARRMAARGAIVRRLAAVEALGSCTLIASDKTGTLTCNALTVRRLVLPDGVTLEVSGEGHAPTGRVLHGDAGVVPGTLPALDDLLRTAVLCNEADLRPEGDGWTWHGDPTDVALLAAGRKAGWVRDEARARWPEVAAVPFEPDRRYAATFHRDGDRCLVAVKGAPERVLAMCAPEPELAEGRRAAAEALAAAGFRVLAFADGAAADPAAASAAEPSGLRFLGLAGMIDPLRPGAREAVRRCAEAGITVAMVTGDHPVTALAIARELGLARTADQVVRGDELEGLARDAMTERVRDVRVFARASPRQKLEIVRAAQAAGHFVAVTGDGVNDAPALRAADVGVAMGRSGTDVAREASELVVTDDDFPTIVAGVEEGRVAYDNVRKVTYLLVSTGAAELVVVGAAVAAGLPLPLLPAQILWLNLATNGIQDVALAFEPNEGDVLARPPRPPRQGIFDRLMIERTLVAGLVVGGVGFAAFRWMLAAGWTTDAARNGLLLLLVLFENFHIGNCRSETKSAFTLSPLRNPGLLLGALAALLLHAFAMVFPPARAVLRTAPLPAATWLALAGLAVSVVVALELHKAWWRRRGAAGA